MKTIRLPERSPLAMTLDEALAKRRTNRNPAADLLKEADLAALLWAAAGITDEDGRRTTPSTLDLRAV